MGILTSDKSRKQGHILRALREHCNKLCVLAFVCGIFSFALLIHEKYCDSTYFSENALLPGLVNREFKEASFASDLYGALKNESVNYNNKIPYSWITSQFRRIGLEVYRQKFILKYPFGKQYKYKGENVYAILRAPRSASTEAIVLSTPYRGFDSIHGTTLPGIAMMIAIAKYFLSKNYWAKDIIFLISDHELVGMQAWLDAYHDIEKNAYSSIDYEKLEGRSGPIQGAINLEIHSDQNSRVELKIEGLNGQLPNLDLFNVAVELATRESITPTFHGQSHPFAADHWEIWKEHALTIGSMMISQAIGLPTGAHGLFQKFAIQSLTLEAIEKRQTDSSHVSVSFLHIGRLIEGIFRSLNNLLEKFNRSYWFYLLPSTRRYISIGYYMISFGLLVIPSLFKALNLYLNLNRDDETRDAKESFSLWNVLPSAFFCHFFGASLASLPFLIEKWASYQVNYGYETQNILYYSLLSFSLILMLNPFLKGQSAEQLKAYKCIALLNLALLFSCLSLLNISLAMFLTLIYIPIACSISTQSRFFLLNLIYKLFVILLHPLVIGYICLLAMSIWYDPQEAAVTHAHRAFEAHKKTILFYVEDWYIYGNWTYLFGTAFLFPLWLQLWYLL
ncbi:glycosylphosphatidylinositol anchor attachment 1 protein-like protein [Dinothrombium tinctorium]|uniref:Glycosylphosphatidylinositol anchor attachment 1 protein-like protein n=1 Tax=Dinothrombium tinctorium TaxID=1965070 RepID=A0A443R717_9ACAR|nr:glycosylphosphatidylinositol anchor attachment 1 protein-like protein [Dinothrombium tinctorium]